MRAVLIFLALLGVAHADRAAVLAQVASARVEKFEPAGRRRIIEKSLMLKPALLARAIAIVRNGKTSDESMMHCFDPHHTLRFFDASNHELASIDVCFECSQLEASRSLGMHRGVSERALDAYRRLFEAAGLTTDAGDEYDGLKPSFD